MIVFDLNQYPPSVSCSQHCRHLITAGYDPQTPIKFVRGNTAVFNENFTLIHWAGKECIESHNGRHMRYVKYTGEDVYICPQESRNVGSEGLPSETEERTLYAQ